MSIIYDHIIVGGGTSGCIVAARLSEAGKRVALFEAGPSDFDKNVEKVNLSNIVDKLTKRYKINETVEYISPRILGGRSSINSCIVFETPDEDLVEWSESGAEGWDPESVKSYLQLVRKKIKFESGNSHNSLLKDIIKSCNHLDINTIRFNDGDNDKCGVGWVNLNKSGEYRESSSVSYLHPLMSNPTDNKIIFHLGTTVTGLLINPINRAVGVITKKGNYYSKGEIILCCGALETPKLLLLSGIGNNKDLNKMGIPVIADVPGVGKNLMDHFITPITYKLSQDAPQESINNQELVIFINVRNKADKRPRGESPNIMISVQLSKYEITFNLNIMRSKNRGSITLGSGDIDIKLNYLSEKEDIQLLIHGVKKVREIMNQHQLKKWIINEELPGKYVNTDLEILDYVKNNYKSIHHAAGTCKMGNLSDTQAVVDSELRVRGIKGLRIADASIFPTMIGVDPTITLMMIGERCADFIKRDDINKVMMSKL